MLNKGHTGVLGIPVAAIIGLAPHKNSYIPQYEAFPAQAASLTQRILRLVFQSGGLSLSSVHFEAMKENLIGVFRKFHHLAEVFFEGDRIYLTRKNDVLLFLIDFKLVRHLNHLF
jgi:hypothetical protein